MNRTKRLWVGLGGSFAIIGLVAGVTLAITTLLGITFDQSQRKPAAAIQPTSIGNFIGPTEAARYSGYSFCVEAIGVDQALAAVAKARLETALLEVMQHPYWNIPQSRASVPPLVDVGCPSEPLIARPGIDWDGPNSRARGNIAHDLPPNTGPLINTVLPVQAA